MPWRGGWYSLGGLGTLCTVIILAGQLNLKWSWNSMVPALSMTTVPLQDNVVASQVSLELCTLRVTWLTLEAKLSASSGVVRCLAWWVPWYSERNCGWCSRVFHTECPNIVAKTDVVTGLGFLGHLAQGILSGGGGQLDPKQASARISQSPLRMPYQAV